MDVLDTYIIPYQGLSFGSHHFEFQVNDDFFLAFEGSEVTSGTVTVKATAEKQNHSLALQLEMDGVVHVPCDRCLGELELPVHCQESVQVKESEQEEVDDNDTLWILPGANEIHLAQYIYESICLSLPYQWVHPRDDQGLSTCDPDMLKRFVVVDDEEFEEEQDEEDA